MLTSKTWQLIDKIRADDWPDALSFAKPRELIRRVQGLQSLGFALPDSE